MQPCHVILFISLLGCPERLSTATIQSCNYPHIVFSLPMDTSLGILDFSNFLFLVHSVNEVNYLE